MGKHKTFFLFNHLRCFSIEKYDPFTTSFFYHKEARRKTLKKLTRFLLEVGFRILWGHYSVESKAMVIWKQSNYQRIWTREKDWRKRGLVYDWILWLRAQLKTSAQCAVDFYSNRSTKINKIVFSTRSWTFNAWHCRGP